VCCHGTIGSLWRSRTGITGQTRFDNMTQSVHVDEDVAAAFAANRSSQNQAGQRPVHVLAVDPIMLASV